MSLVIILELKSRLKKIKNLLKFKTFCNISGAFKKIISEIWLKTILFADITLGNFLMIFLSNLTLNNL